MCSFTVEQRILAALIAAGLALAVSIAPVVAQQTPIPPDFSANLAGWVGLNGGGPFYEPVPGHLPPVVSDPAYPFTPNGVAKQPTFRIADLSNPNLKPWVKEHMKKDIDEVLAGKKSAFTPQSSCVPAGVPFFMGYGGPDPLVFLQTPKEVWIVWREDNQVRRIYMDVPHSANLKLSWYGESVGRYEGDTLVIDTIGLSEKTVVDVYRTPHTEKLHVVERYRLRDYEDVKDLITRAAKENWRPAGPINPSNYKDKYLQVDFTIEDEGTFTTPWTASMIYLRDRGEWPEVACAENRLGFHNDQDGGFPTASKPDF